MNDTATEIIRFVETHPDAAKQRPPKQLLQFGDLVQRLIRENLM